LPLFPVEAVGVDRCMAGTDALLEIIDHQALADRMGISGTPTFLLDGRRVESLEALLTATSGTRR
jgi:protein-disulfide isomerase